MKNNAKAVNIYYCGYEKCLPSHSFGPAIRSHYLIHFVLSGKGMFQSEIGKFPVKEGEAFLIRPQEITFYQADEQEPWEYAWIAFDGMEAERMLELCNLSYKNPVATFQKQAQMREELNQLVVSFKESKESEWEWLGYFYLIFSKINKKAREEMQLYDISYLHRAKEYINHNYSYPIRIREVAQYTGVERTYLYKIFMHYENSSPKQYLTQTRIRVAKELLKSTQYKITEVALSSGFHDASGFCKTFLQIEGITPSQYRSFEGELVK